MRSSVADDQTGRVGGRSRAGCHKDNSSTSADTARSGTALSDGVPSLPPVAPLPPAVPLVDPVPILFAPPPRCMPVERGGIGAGRPSAVWLRRSGEDESGGADASNTDSCACSSTRLASDGGFFAKRRTNCRMELGLDVSARRTVSTSAASVGVSVGEATKRGYHSNWSLNRRFMIAGKRRPPSADDIYHPLGLGSRRRRSAPPFATCVRAFRRPDWHALPEHRWRTDGGHGRNPCWQL